MSMTNLKLFRQFYQIYPEIGQTLSDQFDQLGLPSIGQTLSDQLSLQEDSASFLNPQELLTQLNFSRFIELIRVEDALKRHFYEMEAVKNAWKVRDLARAIDTLLFERTGLSVNKEVVIAKVRNNQKVAMTDLLKNPYLLEFLGLEEKPEYTEHDLESAITQFLDLYSANTIYQN